MDFNYEMEYLCAEYAERTECPEYTENIKAEQELNEITQGMGFAFLGAALIIFLVMCIKEKFLYIIEISSVINAKYSSIVL